MSLTIGLIAGFSVGFEVIFVDEKDKEEMECSYMVAIDIGIFRAVAYF